MGFADLAVELQGACSAHGEAFRANGHCAAVAKANDRIGKVHEAYAELTGHWWQDGNERLVADLQARAFAQLG